MRLAGASSIKEANAFSEMFLLGYNERFALAAKKEGDLHRLLPEAPEIKKPDNEPVKKKSKYIPPADHPCRRHNPSLHHNSYLERI